MQSQIPRNTGSKLKRNNRQQQIHNVPDIEVSCQRIQKLSILFMENKKKKDDEFSHITLNKKIKP